MTRVLIGVPTFRRPHLLRRLLKSLQEQVTLAEIVVFVADNDPERAEGAAVAREMCVDYEIVAEPGISAARNAILLHAYKVGADYVAMIDDDETASPQWIAELLKQFAETGADVVGGRRIFQFGESVPRAIRSAFYQPSHLSGPIDCLHTSANFMISSRSLYEASWPRFNLTFGLTGGEDDEYFQRLRQKGFTFAWSNEAVSYEPVPSSRANAEWVIKRAYRCGNSNTRVALLHGNLVRAGLISGRALAVILLSPVLALTMLPSPLWLPQKVATALGRLSALFGYRSSEYAR